MNINNIITELEKVDPEVYDRLDSRRSYMQQFAKVGSRLALAAFPLALGGMFKKAYGKNTDTIVEILNYALTLEYLESEFYKKAVATASGIFPSPAGLGAFTTIRDHEVAHVNLLKGAISAAGGTPVAMPTFDFSAGNGSGTGPFADVFTNYDTLLAVAQTFEDTGVRAYKGRAGELISDNATLTVALQIHSVEARHASHIRQMRKARGANVKPWITGKDSGIGAIVQASYDGEETASQAGVNIASVGGVSADAATESFDEPLSKAAVLLIVDPFIV